MQETRQDGFFAWITGIVGEVLGYVFTGSTGTALFLALAGGFLGYVGKEMGARFIKKIFKNSKQDK